MKKIGNSFTHIHCHSGIGSMNDSMVNIDELFKKASILSMPAVALTDHGSMAGVFDARRASKKYGVKYIPGMEAYFVNDIDDPKEKRKHIVLLAKNEIGYRNLLQLNYQGFKNKQYVPILNKVFPRIDWKLLEKYSEGIICSTACVSGVLAQEMFLYNDNNEWDLEASAKRTHKTLSKLINIFDKDLYLELQPHDMVFKFIDRKTGEPKLDKNGNPIIRADQHYVNTVLIELSKQYGIGLVATCDVHYLSKEDAEVHDMLTAINEKKPLNDPTRYRYSMDGLYLQTRTEVESYLAKTYGKRVAKFACDNTVRIANKCGDTDYLDASEPRFPRFPIEDEKDFEEFLIWNEKQNSKADQDDFAFMRFRCVKAFKQKFSYLDGRKKKEYVKRMMDEIKVYELKNFSSYMLVVSDFILAAKENGIPIGPGRGSVAGSLVGYLLDIHSVDPIEYGLLFERFLNKEKTAFPDVDTDISPDGRDWVKQYIVNKYGEKTVAHVSNLSRMTPKVVVKDIARSLQLGGSKSEAFKIANAITDTIPDNCNTFDEALHKSPEFVKYCVKYPDLEKFGRKLAGLEKAYATHAAGLIVADVDLSTYVPLRFDKNGDVSVQYEKNRCEASGLIKIDLLGLEHLKIINNTVKNARSLGLKCPDPDDVLLDDKAVWDSISSGDTMCVFQMESPHMKDLCKRIRPKNIEDLSLVNALGRPSAKDTRNTYINRRDGKEPVTFKYSCLKNSLKKTLGVCVYEEQLMNIAFDAANWDRNKADGFRKLTKMKEKGDELAAILKKDFIRDASKHSNITQEQVADIWKNVIEAFGEYGFNASHGISYSINGYHSAYYKHYFPSSFMAAVLKSEVEKASSPTRDSNIRTYKKEAKRLGILITAPDINNSGTSFSVLDTNTIVTGLTAIKGVGERAVNNIIETRDEHKFKSFEDFLLRTSSGLVRKNVIQPLAKSGCFDNLNITRKNAFEQYSVVRTAANKYHKKIAEEGRDSWDILNDFEMKDKFDTEEEWTLKEKLLGEQESLGEYISGTANDLYDGFFTGKMITSFNSAKSLSNGQSFRTEAFLTDIKKAKLKKGKNSGKEYARCVLQDIKGTTLPLTIWPDQWLKVKKYLDIGRPIRAICKINIWNDTTTLVLERIEARAEVKE